MGRSRGESSDAWRLPQDGRRGGGGGRGSREENEERAVLGEWTRLGVVGRERSSMVIARGVELVAGGSVDAVAGRCGWQRGVRVRSGLIGSVLQPAAVTSPLDPVLQRHSDHVAPTPVALPIDQAQGSPHHGRIHRPWPSAAPS